MPLFVMHDHTYFGGLACFFSVWLHDDVRVAITALMAVPCSADAASFRAHSYCVAVLLYGELLPVE